MPTYEYRCKECGRELEVVQSFTDDALTTCESCGGVLRKVFGSIGITFKGSGFYKTDSRSTSNSTSSSGDGGGDGKSSDTTSDTKPSDTKPSTSKTSGGKPAEKKPESPAATAKSA